MNTQEAVLGMAEDLGSSGNKLMNITQKIGQIAGIASALSAWYEYNENPTTGGLIKALANTSLAFARINPAAGVVIGVLDLTGVTDKAYEYMGETIDNKLKL